MKYSLFATLLSITGTFAAPLQLTTRDVNRDGFRNLLLRKSDLHLSLEVWANDKWLTCEIGLTPPDLSVREAWGVCDDGYVIGQDRTNVVEDFQVEGQPERPDIRHEFYGQGLDLYVADPAKNGEDGSYTIEASIMVRMVDINKID